MESLDPFRAHERDLVELHKEMRAGRGDDERADRLRDAMESAWRQLNESQRLQMGQLSADLAMIERDEYTESLDAEVDLDDLKRSANAAYEEKRFGEALVLFRKAPNLWMPFRLARMRAVAWHALGLREAAKCFLDFAIECAPAAIRRLWKAKQSRHDKTMQANLPLLVHFASEQIQGLLLGQKDNYTARQIDDILRESISLYKVRTPERKELFVLLGMIENEISSQRWSDLVKNVHSEFADLDLESLALQIEERREHFLWSEDVPSDRLPRSTSELWEGAWAA